MKSLIIGIIIISAIVGCYETGNPVGSESIIEQQKTHGEGETNDAYHRIVIEYDHPAVCSISFGRGYYWDARRFIGASVQFYDDSVVIVDTMNVIREKWLIKVD